MRFSRITVDPNLMGGVPCIRGLRLPVASLVGMVADGMADAEILRDYPDLEAADIREALHYAAAGVRERESPLVKAVAEPETANRWQSLRPGHPSNDHGVRVDRVLQRGYGRGV